MAGASAAWRTAARVEIRSRAANARSSTGTHAAVWTWNPEFAFVAAIDVLGLPLPYLRPAQRKSGTYAFGWIGGLVMLWHAASLLGARSLVGVLRPLAVVVCTIPVLDHAYRRIFSVKGCRPDMGLVAT